MTAVHYMVLENETKKKKLQLELTRDSLNPAHVTISLLTQIPRKETLLRYVKFYAKLIYRQNTPLKKDKVRAFLEGHMNIPFPENFDDELFNAIFDEHIIRPTALPIFFVAAKLDRRDLEEDTILQIIKHKPKEIFDYMTALRKKKNDNPDIYPWCLFGTQEDNEILSTPRVQLEKPKLKKFDELYECTLH